MINKWPHYEKDEIFKIEQILKSGKVNYWTGNEGKNFEKEFAKFAGTKYAIALANGSLALSAAYLAINIKEGDEIITTPRTFIATSSAALLLKAKPIFADVDRDTGCISAKTIKPLINSKTKAISIVHLGGWPADMKSITKIAADNNLKLVEDCSQAHGAAINGKSVGSFGDIGTWSFCQDKIISTGGEGGMITTNDENIYRKIFSLKDHGKNFSKYIQKSQNNFNYLHDDLGSNFRLTELQASIGRIQLTKLSNWIEIRNRNSKILDDYLKCLSVIRVPDVPQLITHARYRYYCYLKKDCLKANWSRDLILSRIKELNLPAYSGSCSEIYLENSISKVSKVADKNLPVAKELGENSIAFLVHPTITIKQMHHYAFKIKNILLLAQK
tara:strand:+ start:596 stop:1756 length:1161 start_codon:yes stop_codon:yes gene_type:complete